MNTLALILWLLMVQPMHVDTLINDIIAREGGYVNHPADKGGPTKYGITLKTLSAARRMPQTAKDVQNLSKSEAFDIYKKEYYIDLGVEKFPETIHDLILDMNVLHGPYYTNRMLQKAINHFGMNLKVDGVVGSKTLTAVKEVNPIALRYVLSKEREDFVRDYAVRDPTQTVFLNGWIKRINKFIET